MGTRIGGQQGSPNMLTSLCEEIIVNEYLLVVTIFISKEVSSGSGRHVILGIMIA